MRLLFFSDPHFTDNPRDGYRFELFPWLLEQQKNYKVDAVICGGDITDSKDQHSAVLVNLIVEGFRMLKPPVYICRGNHDCLSDQPFFEFLNEIEGIKFFSNFGYADKIKTAFIPHQKTQEELDFCFSKMISNSLVMMHQTITGAISESGQQLTGLTIPDNKARAIYSGDIHTPHTITFEVASGADSLTYIGSPFAVRFGDNFKSRVLLLDINDRGKITEKNLYFPAPKKLHLYIRDVSEMPKLKEGDQVKIDYELPPSEIVEWEQHKKKVVEYCQQRGIEIYGLELKKEEYKKSEKPKIQSKNKEDYFTSFCNKEKLPKQIRDAGKALIEG